MLDILTKASAFILIILLGYTLKTKGIFKKEQAKFLSIIIMNITLPCALFASVSQIEITSLLLITLLIGLLTNIVYICIGYFLKTDSMMRKALYMINLSGYNIGTFALPFVQSFFPAHLLAYVVMFDTGNAIMCLGGTYSVTSSVMDSSSKFSIQEFLRKLFTSIPFCTYVILFLLSLFKITLPTQLVEVASIAGNANPFLAMLMIGISLEIKMNEKDRKSILNIITIRYTMAILFLLLIYYFLPADMRIKQMIILCLFSPVSSVAPVYSIKVGSDSPIPAAVNSISMILSICSMTALLLIFAI